MNILSFIFKSSIAIGLIMVIITAGASDTVNFKTIVARCAIGIVVFLVGYIGLYKMEKGSE